ncbi:matrilysin isoform X2 [Pteropus medius]|uniref:matrilysin isoform X2 n=1 Tax=Pteropus vampyrus TaxID=132908 RepID=UPI00196B60E4|nr:matrilysin isoform X2 [Pteropus giganteus]
MQLAVLCAVCLLPSSLALPLPPEAGGMSEPQWEQAQGYLKRFYPFDSKTRGANSLEAKLKEMQKFFRLPITGMLSSRIIEIMQKPRCGMPDVAEYSLFPESPKWTSKVVTYRIISYTRDLSHFQVNQLVEKAFEMWSKEIPLHFKRIRWGIADIMIGFARGGINFLYTATHELGHSLGLGHSSDPNAVMYPTYGDKDSKDFKLSQDDIKEIQKLYGERSD